MDINSEKQRKKIVRFINRMPSLSTTVGKVLEVCNKIDPSPNELNKVVSLDPVLTGQVLKLINSSYYSLVNKVTSLPRAITMLGMNTVKNMALSTAIIATVGLSKSSTSLPISKFWAHSLGVGVAAKLIAKHKGLDILQREELFFAGLLHDLGKVSFGDDYAIALDKVEQEEIPLVEAEEIAFGITHEDVGGMICEKWKLNEFLTSAISNHHNTNFSKEDERIAYLALANMYFNTIGGDAGNQFPNLTRKNELLELVNITWEEITDLQEEIESEIERAKIFLQV
ncbi:MAG: HDOD domain-containing protein [Desulfotalea sp.]